MRSAARFTVVDVLRIDIADLADRRDADFGDVAQLAGRQPPPEKSLLETLKKHSGRNNLGRITVRHRGGGNRRKYRVIDFKRDKADMKATVLTLE